MRQFYQEYHESPKLQPLIGEIGWTHNLVIMGRCKDLLEREFYIRMTRKFDWSKNVLTLFRPIEVQKPVIDLLR
jgi:predicted nuclease of restriction endonuclease-like (RecB) superfamily